MTRLPRNVCVCPRCLMLYTSRGVRCILCVDHPECVRVDLVPRGGAAVIRAAVRWEREGGDSFMVIQHALDRMRERGKKRRRRR